MDTQRPEPTLASLVDLTRYPLDRPGSRELMDVIAHSRGELATQGCSVLEAFFGPGLERLRREAAQLAPQAYIQERYGNPYSSADDPSLPADHPVRARLRRTQGFVAADRIPPDTALRRVYHDASFRRFVGACLSVDTLYEYADPLGQLVINVVGNGGEHPWHFDTGEFVVSTLLQAPHDGGLFEYCPNIRSSQDENFAGVSRVLQGEARHETKPLSLRPGDVQLFLGRYSLHRVQRVYGTQPRLSAIFSYARHPGMIATAQRSQHLFGRITERHASADDTPNRCDALRD